MDIILSEDTLAHTNLVLTGGSPVELLHTSITDKGSVQSGEIVTGHNDGHTGDGFLVVNTRQLDIGGVVSDVHEGGVHHLVVDGVLSGSFHSSRTSVEIVDEEGAHLPLLDDVGSFPVPLHDELSGLTGVSRLQLSGTHHDGATFMQVRICKYIHWQYPA